MTPIDLSGLWQVTLDPDNRDLPPVDDHPAHDYSVPLPGSLPEQQLQSEQIRALFTQET